MIGLDYAVSKAAVLNLDKIAGKIRGAVQHYGANSVAPELIGTDMTKDFGYDADGTLKAYRNAKRGGGCGNVRRIGSC